MAILFKNMFAEIGVCFHNVYLHLCVLICEIVSIGVMDTRAKMVSFIPHIGSTENMHNHFVRV